MKLTIEPTAEIITVEGQPMRVWQGTDANGTGVKLFVRAVQPQTHDALLLAEFDAELQALPQLRPGAIDYRFFAD